MKQHHDGKNHCSCDFQTVEPELNFTAGVNECSCQLHNPTIKNQQDDDSHYQRTFSNIKRPRSLSKRKEKQQSCQREQQ